MKFSPKWPNFPATRTHLFLRWSRNLFLIIGLMALSYSGFVLHDAQFYQAYLSWRFKQALKAVGETPRTALRMLALFV